MMNSRCLEEQNIREQDQDFSPCWASNEQYTYKYINYKVNWKMLCAIEQRKKGEWLKGGISNRLGKTLLNSWCLIDNCWGGNKRASYIINQERDSRQREKSM